METFHYIAADGAGKQQFGTIDAESPTAASDALSQRSLHVLHLEPAKHHLQPNKFEAWFDRLQRVSLTERTLFTQNLFIMIKSGMSITQALDTLAKQTTNKYFGKAVLQMKQVIEKGGTFAKALGEHPNLFSEIYVNMVAAGEVSGKLESILQQLALQMKKERVLLSKVRSAMMYPIIVVSVMIVIGIAMLVYVIPKMKDIYTELGGQLPAPTRVLIAISDFATNNGILTAGMAIGAVVLFRFLYRSPRGKRFFHGTLLRLPVASTIVVKLHVARFTRTLQSLLKTDLPIVQSFHIIEHTLGNVHYKEAMRAAADALQKGRPIVEPLAARPRLFPPMVTQMIAVGEMSGKLDELTGDIAQFYEEDLDETMSNFSSIIEPVLLLILGVGVAAIAISILLPIYSITNQI